ncbi:MAG TPA: carboxypeptidase-like regulatory domain-containing protein, partial [Acidimicrobiales bacterium]|nr:carboxypeptidase-like regulatory domain-containing protein [Acidimicrobiales bacterium]
GTVTAAKTHKPLADACAYALGSTALLGGLVTSYSNGQEVGLARSNAKGQYEITALSPGGYLVEFYPCASGAAGNYLSSIWHEAATIVDTPPVTVTAGHTTGGVSAALLPGGTITGTITASASHAPIGGVCAVAVNEALGAFFEAVTSSTGAYVMAGLPGGAYEAEFTPCTAEQNWTASLYRQGASFRVEVGTVTAGISGALAKGGQIEGAVGSASGEPLTGICELIQSSSTGPFPVEVGPVGFAGRFEIDGLTAGDYSIGFSGDCVNQNYLTSWWDNSKAVSVPAGGVVEGVKVHLSAGGEIAGRVTDATGHALSYMCAETGGAQILVLYESLSFLGNYELRGLPIGKYAVAVFPCIPSANYLGKLLPHRAKTGIAEVTKVPTVALHQGAAISGTVTDTGRVPLTDICVTAIEAFNPGIVETATWAGSYTITQLTAGSYEVEFAPCQGSGWNTQWWKGAATQAKATAITVKPAATTSGIDATMTQKT